MLWATCPGLVWHLLWVWRAESYLVLLPLSPEKAEQAKVWLIRSWGRILAAARKEVWGGTASPILPTVRASSRDDLGPRLLVVPARRETKARPEALG